MARALQFRSPLSSQHLGGCQCWYRFSSLVRQDQVSGASEGFFVLFCFCFENHHREGQTQGALSISNLSFLTLSPYGQCLVSCL